MLQELRRGPLESPGGALFIGRRWEPPRGLKPARFMRGRKQRSVGVYVHPNCGVSTVDRGVCTPESRCTYNRLRCIYTASILFFTIDVLRGWGAGRGHRLISGVQGVSRILLWTFWRAVGTATRRTLPDTCGTLDRSELGA